RQPTGFHPGADTNAAKGVAMLDGGGAHAGRGVVRVLISLCNVGHGAPSLLVLDTASRTITPLAISSGCGATGLCVLGEEIVVAYQRQEACVGMLDARTLRLRFEAPLAGARDVHSVTAWNGGLAVASTGTDEVLWYRYDGTAFTDRTVLWSGGTGEGDLLHVNAVAVHDGTLLCCAFGPRRSQSDLWSDARGGFVYDVVNRRVVLDDLGHPHTLISLGGELYLCESSRRLFRSIDRSIAALNGYTRGVAPLGGARLLVGTSVGRVTSRSTGRILNPADRGLDAGTCALHEVGLDGSVGETISLSGYGREIYDIVPLS
ncbi:MAG TPA: DUF4915 domain-containing protein, partial [Candidatus Elarobacter sp.]|nr:DUF4915 domain-containing protein [Candidatus Elarobacter sp.]